MPERQGQIRLPTRELSSAPVAIVRRFMLAVALVLLNWLLVAVERDGYTDSGDGVVSLTDALYYTTVTLTTTGYGDITPVSPSARLVNALLVTPMRLLFVVILVGTTIQALTERSREQFRISRWRSRVRDHIIVLGYGTKGRNAVRELLLKGRDRDKIVVVEVDPHAGAAATTAGFVTVVGPATSQEVLRDALIEDAKVVVVALGRDDTAVRLAATDRIIYAEA